LLTHRKVEAQLKPLSNVAKYSGFLFLVRRVVNKWTLSLTVVCLLLNTLCQAQQGDERTFATPGDAALALYTAVKANDEASLSGIFGKAAGDLLHSGDEVADRNMAQTFLSRYDQMHRVVIEPDGTATLYIGAENWPFPISIAKTSSGTWYFDVAAGKQEILYRRVGRNENDAIEVCQALVQAQHEYVSAVRNNESSKHYAMRFISDDGKQNGLFWKSSEGEPPSPIGPLIVQASSEGYSAQKGQPTPFHGYYYRILTKQGHFAKGGKKNYLVKGELVRGFAFLAYPADYKNSGVMTFAVNQDGIVYQKDLGPDTETIAAHMTLYDPDDTWERVDQ
jgi:hypothetical protein